MERTKSAAFRLRDAGQWKAQFYGHAKICKHDKSIPKITDLSKSIEYSHTPFEALSPDREEWDQGRPGTTDAICFYNGSKLEGQVGGGVYSEQLDIRKFRLPDHFSVFQAEVNAIKEALTCLGNLSLQRMENVGMPMATCNLDINEEERCSRVPRLSDTRYQLNRDMQAAKRN